MKKTRMLRATLVLSGTSFRNVKFKNRFRAEGALIHLRRILKTLYQVSLRDFYEIAWADCRGRDWNMTDSEGWTNLDTAKIVPIKYGYLIELPEPVTLVNPKTWC
jgi:hypothetical protein